jgi:hypothetical protein
MRWVVLAMSLVACAGSDDSDDLSGSPCAPVGETYTVALASSDPQLRFDAERCEADASTCHRFCMRVVNRRDPLLYVRSCMVEFAGDTATVTAQVSTCPPDVGPVDAGTIFPD